MFKVQHLKKCFIYVPTTSPINKNMHLTLFLEGLLTWAHLSTNGFFRSGFFGQCQQQADLLSSGLRTNQDGTGWNPKCQHNCDRHMESYVLIMSLQMYLYFLGFFHHALLHLFIGCIWKRIEIQCFTMSCDCCAWMCINLFSFATFSTSEKKSCTTWDVENPVNNGMNYQAQLVSQDFFHQQYLSIISLNHLQGLIHPSWCRICSINSIKVWMIDSLKNPPMHSARWES